MKALLICFLFIFQAFGQSHTGTGFLTDDEKLPAGALTCEKVTAKTAEVEKQFMLSAKQPIKGPKDFYAFIDNYFLKESIKFLSIPLPFTKIQPVCSCDEKSITILKKIHRLYKEIEKKKWYCLENKERIKRIPDIEKILIYYEK